jgi:hypothetical protein
MVTLWAAALGCPHHLADLDEPAQCGAARRVGTRDAWAAAYWADPEGGCHDEALSAIRRAGPAGPPAPEPSSSILTGHGRVPRAVQDLLTAATTRRVHLDSGADGIALEGWLEAGLEPVRQSVERCVSDGVAGRARLLGAVGPSGAVRVGRVEGDPDVSGCVGGLDEVELPPSVDPRPLDVTIVVDRR